jgi:hypothetical protein
VHPVIDVRICAVGGCCAYVLTSHVLRSKCPDVPSRSLRSPTQTGLRHPFGTSLPTRRPTSTLTRDWLSTLLVLVAHTGANTSTSSSYVRGPTSLIMVPQLTVAHWQWPVSLDPCLRTHSWRRCGQERPSARGPLRRYCLRYGIVSQLIRTSLILLQIKTPLLQCLPNDAMAGQRFMPWLDNVVNGMKATVCTRNVDVADIAHTVVCAGHRR